MSHIDPKDEPQIPDGFRRALLDLHTPHSRIPPHIDLAILARARQDYRGRRRMWIGTRWAAIALTAAAMVTVAVRLWTPVAESPKPQVAQLGDVNHDNHVNILDAYIVARHIARNQPLDKAWDINGDGVVDQKDVDLIAAMAVAAHNTAPDPEQAR